MKSLEIVNEHIKFIDNHRTQIKGTPVMIDELQQIKQDLDVLEIIRKKDVNLATLKFCIMITDTIEQLLSKYNRTRYFTQDELTMEELLKLKQWLEVNEE